MKFKFNYKYYLRGTFVILLILVVILASSIAIAINGSEEVKKISAEILGEDPVSALVYGVSEGYEPLRETVRKWLKRRGNIGTDEDVVIITAGGTQVMDITTRVLTSEGDTVICEEPSFIGSLNCFRSHGCKLAGVPIDADGMNMQALERVIKENPNAKFIYTIPNFQNPGGTTMSLEERRQLCALSEKYGFVIVEDAPYRELRYSGEAVPTIYSMAPERTLHLGTFSKIFAPGFRLGWIFGPEELLDKIYVCKQSLDLCPPVLDQYMAAEFMGSGRLDANLKKSIALYREKRDLMLSLLERHMPDGVSWTHPEGGLFLFLTLPERLDTVAMYNKALGAGVAYVAGSFFYPDGSHRNTMRLNFSFLDRSRMEEGIKLLADVIGSSL